MQGYNPAIHIIRRGLSAVGLVTWLLLGGRNTSCSDMIQIRGIEDVGAQFISSVADYLSDAVTGCGVRVEGVVTGNTSSDVLSLVPSYGSRLLEFCINQELLSYSSKNWPFYIDCKFMSVLRRIVSVVEVAHKEKFDRNVRIIFSIF